MTELPAPPPAVRRISKIIGLEPTIALIENYVGGPIYVPSRPIDGSELVETVGQEAAEKLCQEWANNYLRIPVARNWLILVYHSRKMTYAEIARKVRCSQNHVWWVLSKAERTARQYSLFE